MLRLGLIGCGRISKNHFEAVAGLEDAKVMACCDIIEERARSAAEQYRIPFWTTRIEELLARQDVDAVSICTPSGLHPAHGILAAQAGKHVISEKPMGIRLADADAMIKACRENGVKLFVVLQNRLNPSIQLIRRALDKGRFGKIYMITANVFWTRPQDYYDMAPWRGTWEFDGGAFMNQASHYVDLVQWLGGPVDEVSAINGTLARHIEAEDTGAAILRFASGAIGSMNVTTLTYPKNLEGSITVIGENGTVRIGGIAVNKILHWEFASEDEDDLLVQEAATNPGSVYGFGHIGYYRNVLDVLENGGAPMSDGSEGRKSLELISALYTANRGKRVVSL